MRQTFSLMVQIWFLLRSVSLVESLKPHSIDKIATVLQRKIYLTGVQVQTLEWRHIKSVFCIYHIWQHNLSFIFLLLCSFWSTYNSMLQIKIRHNRWNSIKCYAIHIYTNTKYWLNLQWYHHHQHHHQQQHQQTHHHSYASWTASDASLVSCVLLSKFINQQTCNLLWPKSSLMD